MSVSRLDYLLERHINQACTLEEQDELMHLIQDSRFDEAIKERMERMWYGLPEEKQLDIARADSIFSNVLTEGAQEEDAKDGRARLISLPGKRRARWVAAASVLLLVATGSYLFFNRQPVNTEKETAEAVRLENDIEPGGNKAMLTLADGSTIVLDTASQGNISVQGNTRVIKLNNGLLSYKTSNKQPAKAEEAYNTITTPKGGQYQIVLPDGSRVWLNAVSSLTFPVAFSGNKRSVELRGEAYFEIVRNKTMPFSVKVNDANIEVLGTEFNVMAYTDEDAIKATLVDGSVKVTNKHSTTLLLPRQQAAWTPGMEMKVEDNVDIEEVTAWKNGLFLFNNATIQTIMRQAARWYDIEVAYEGSTTERFNGSLPRSVTAATLFKVFESADDVRFTIEGKRVKVKL